MPVNLYDPRTMLKALRTALPAQTFIRDMFFSQRDPVETEHVDIDIVKGNRKMAPFVAPIKSGSVMAREGYTTNSYKPAMLKPKRQASDVDWGTRLPGETLYSGMSPDERAARLYVEDLLFLDQAITRREEWMCAKALTEGKIVQRGDGVDEEIAFPLSITTLGDDDKWTKATGKPLTKLRDTRRAMVKACGIAPNTIVMGASALAAFLENAEVQTFSDKNKILLTEIEPQIPLATLETMGVIYWGYMRDTGLYVYTYDEWYYDEGTGQEKAMIADDIILLGNPAARTSLMYGAWTEANREKNSVVTHVGDRVPRSWVEDDPSVRWVQMVSRPLPVPHQIDAFRVLKVV
ncbi:MAG: major capsid protein [Aminivibrio sp.]|jgi:hypothetical protein